MFAVPLTHISSAVSASTVSLGNTKGGHFFWYQRNLLQRAARLNYWPEELKMGYNQASKPRALISHTVNYSDTCSDCHFRVTFLTT